jgi:hypothetical protein
MKIDGFNNEDRKPVDEIIVNQSLISLGLIK